MGDEGDDAMRTGWRVRAVTLAAVVLLVGATGVLVRGALLGETVASGPGWELKVRASPVLSSITWEEPRRSGGASGLARPGQLSEAVRYAPPDGSATYVVGLLPEDAITVWASADDQDWRAAEIRHVLGTPYYVAALDGQPGEVVIEARDDQVQLVARQELPPPPPSIPAPPPPPPADP